MEGKTLTWALRIGALCNAAETGDGGASARTGDPMELSLLETAAGAGVARTELGREFKQVRQHAFEPERKMMATVHARDGQFLYAVKGAPEAVIHAATCMMGGRRAPPDR